MEIYIICIIVATGISFIASRCSGWRRVAIAFLAIVPFCLVAAFRDITVGTDTAGYPWFSYRMSLTHSLPDLFLIDNGSTEPLFLLVVWVVTQAFGSFAPVLFFLQALISVPVIVVLVQKYPRTMPLGVLVYGLIYFCFSLNYMRQMIAMAFTLFAFYNAMNDSYRIAFLITAVGCGFHNTAIFGFALIAYYMIAIRGRKEGASHADQGLFILVTLAAMACLVLAFVFGRQVLVLLSSIKESYSYQVEHAGIGDTSISLLIFGIAPFIIDFFERASSSWRVRVDTLFLKIMVLAGGITAQFAVISPELARIGLFFHFFSVLLFPELLEGRTRVGVLIVCFSGLLLGAMLFYLIFVIGGGCEVIPYSFAASAY